MLIVAAHAHTADGAPTGGRVTVWAGAEETCGRRRF